MQRLVPGLIVAVLAFLLFQWGDSTGSYRATLEWKVKVAEKDVQLQTARAEAAEQEIEHQRAQTAAIDRINQAHDQAVAEMQRTTAADRVTADGLRADLASLRAKLQAGNTSAGQQADHATKASMVLSELYEGCAAQRRDLAESLEGAGLQIQSITAQYNKIRGL